MTESFTCMKCGEEIGPIPCLCVRDPSSARGQRERMGAAPSEANAMAGETSAPTQHDPSTDVADIAALVCPACDGDDDLIDNLGDGEHATCLGCGHCWAPFGHLEEHKSAVEVGCTACSTEPPVQPDDWPDDCDLRLWRAEVDGATYWIAAESMMDAMCALASCFSDEGMNTELEPRSLAIEYESVAKAWKAIVTNEDPPGRMRMFNAVVDQDEKSGEAVVLACSEWP